MTVTDKMQPSIVLSGVPEALHALAEAAANDAGTEEPFHAALASAHAYARQHAAAVAGPLVEALERLLPHVAHLVHFDDDDQSVLEACVDRARAALASFKESQK